jgi:hypothetical protein
VLIPAIRRHPSESQRIELFEQFEARFALQARVTTRLAGAHLMTFVWLAFTAVLFVLEPLFLHRLFVSQARKNSDRALGVLQAMHWVVLISSLVAITGAVAGTRGYLRL